MENKEKLLDAKIELIKKKAREQEERERRLREEEEQLLAELGYGRKNDTPKHPAVPKQDNDEVEGDDVAEGKVLTVRTAHMDDPEFINASKPAVEALKWREERLRADVDREARTKKADGSWSREWDKGKDRLFVGQKNIDDMTSGGWNRSRPEGNGVGGADSATNRRNNNHVPQNNRVRDADNHRRSGHDQRNKSPQPQSTDTGGWSPKKSSSQTDGREKSTRGPLHLRRNYDDEPSDNRPKKDGQPQNADTSRRSAGGYNRNAQNNHTDTRPQRGGGRGLARRAPHARHDQPAAPGVKKDQPATDETWGDTTASQPSEAAKAVVAHGEEDWGVEPSKPDNSSTEAATTCENGTHGTHGTHGSDETGNDKSAPTSPVVKTQGSEEEQYEDVEEDFASPKGEEEPSETPQTKESSVEPDVPSSEFASMSASDADLQTSGTCPPGADALPEAEAANASICSKSEEVVAVANQLVSDAIDAAIDVVADKAKEEIAIAADESSQPAAENDVVAAVAENVDENSTTNGASSENVVANHADAEPSSAHSTESMPDQQ